MVLFLDFTKIVSYLCLNFQNLAIAILMKYLSVAVFAYLINSKTPLRQQDIVAKFYF